MEAVDTASPTSPAASIPSHAEVPWGSILWFSVLLAITYFTVIKLLAAQWSVDEDVSHGFFVPPIAAYITWQRRQELFSTPWKPNILLGSLAVAWGITQLVLGTLGAELFLQRTSLVVTIAGGVLLMGGWQILKIVAFPLAVLLFMIPLPKVVYGQLTLPLQLFASRVAEHALLFMEIPVLRDGNVIELANTKLSVVEACSGIRSLLSLSFVSLVYGYFTENRTWMRWALFFSTVPIAIFANALRVTMTGVLAQKDPELAQGFMHSVEGWVIFIVALVLLLGAHKLFNLFTRKTAAGNSTNETQQPA